MIKDIIIQYLHTYPDSIYRYQNSGGCYHQRQYDLQKIYLGVL